MKLDQPITLKQAKSIRKNYLKNNKGKTQQVFFEYNKLMNYLTEIVKDPRLQDIDKVGIKIYFAEYDAQYTGNNMKDRITVMLVPTIKIGDINQDVLDNTGLDENGYLNNVLEAYNHGSLCPPFDEVDPGGNECCSGSDLNA